MDLYNCTNTALNVGSYLLECKVHTCVIDGRIQAISAYTLAFKVEKLTNQIIEYVKRNRQITADIQPDV